MIAALLLAYMTAVGPSDARATVRDSFLRDGVKPADFPRLTPRARAGRTHLAGTGSGFFIAPEGWLVTSRHVVGDAAEVVLVHQGSAYLADVVAQSSAKDLALLKVNLFPRATNGVIVVNGLPTVPCLPFATGVDVGQTVYAVGFPETDILGHEVKVTRGIVNSATGFRDNADLLQMDATVTHGNSGGPVVDEYGAVVGVVRAGIDKSIGNYSYAVRQEVVRAFVAKKASVRRGAATRRLSAQRLAKRVSAATVLVLAYGAGACPRISETTVDADDSARREAETALRQAVLSARLLKLRKAWRELKELTDAVLARHGGVGDVRELNDLARDELGEHLVIVAEADGCDVTATVKPVCGFRDPSEAACGRPLALGGGKARRSFPVEARLTYDDGEWAWAGTLSCVYDWRGTKEMRVVLKRVGKR